MSESINIISKKAIAPDDIFDALEEGGEDLCIVSGEFPRLYFGTFDKALRGVEVFKDERGYEIRACSFSSFDDYRLFRTTIDTIRKLTRGKVEYDGEIIKGFDSYETFSDNWIDRQVECGVDVVRVMCLNDKSPITMYGLFAPFCFGKRMMDYFGLNDGHKPDVEETYKILKYFREMQWRLENMKSTKSNLMLKGEDGENDKDISLISIKNNKVSDFDYISFAQMVSLCDLDNDDIALIELAKFIDIVPKEKVEFLDDYQMLVKIKFTAEDVRQMITNANETQSSRK